VYEGEDFKHYFLPWLNGWSVLGEAVAGAFGEMPPAIAYDPGAGNIVAYSPNGSGITTALRLGAENWFSLAHAPRPVAAIQPAMAARPRGGVLLVYAGLSGELYWGASSPGANLWPLIQEIPEARSADRVALTATADGAILVFRGLNDELYWSRLATSWSIPARVAALSTSASPALAPGIDGHDAELLYVDPTDDTARHLSLSGDTWSTPIPIALSATSVAIATTP
jgi:hypothetical protein